MSPWSRIAKQPFVTQGVQREKLTKPRFHRLGHVMSFNDSSDAESANEFFIWIYLLRAKFCRIHGRLAQRSCPMSNACTRSPSLSRPCSAIRLLFGRHG